MTPTVDRKINMMPLLADHREECVVEAFRELEPGQTLQVIDDFDPEWIRPFLERECDCRLTDENFVVRETAGRYVVPVIKPESPGEEGLPDSGSRDSLIS